MLRSKMMASILLLALSSASVLAYAWSSGSLGFEVYESHTYAWHISLGNIGVGTPKSFNITVGCKESAGEFLATYFLEITGPESLCNDYLRLRWRDTDSADFTIGKDGDQTFSGTGTISWNSSAPTVFTAGHKNNITLTLTFLTLDALGDYNAKIWVAFTKKPQVITPKVLNIKSQGQWVTAHISLPEPYNEKNIDIDSVKLWFKGNFVRAVWGIATNDSLMVKFSRNEVIRMLGSEKGQVKLSVTGLFNGIEFSGTDTITVIG